MRAVEDIIIDEEVVTGGGGGSITSAGSGNVILTNTPNTVLSNQSYIINVNSNVKDADIIVNGESVSKKTNNSITIAISDLLLNGDTEIILKKDGYVSNERYVVSLVANPDYNRNPNYNTAAQVLGNNSGMDAENLYASLPNSPIASLEYSKESLYTIDIKHYINDFKQSYKTFSDGQYSNNILFKLEKQIIPDEPLLKFTTINLDGPEGSVVVIPNIENSDGVLTTGEKIVLKSGNNKIAIPEGSKAVIQSADLKNYRVKTINVESDTYKPKTVDAKTNEESVSVTFDLNNANYNISVISEMFVTKIVTKPTIALNNSEPNRKYNLNSKADYPIGLSKSTDTYKITAYINNQTFVFSNLDTSQPSLFKRKESDASKTAVIIIPAKAFSTIGNYKLILVPSDIDGDGDKLELTINVNSEQYVGVPDIRNIKYPSLLKGPDFVGTDVNFAISYESVNTDYVKIYKVGSDRFIRATAAGLVNLNFQELLKLDGTQVSETDDLINITLKLVPYNESGYQVVVGKEEFINISFDKGDLTIPRDVAIGRIADGFISQFDSTIFENETSKYLTHLLHIGNGDNKVITTWVGSDGSLILKLYEPLATSVQTNQQVWISKLQSQPIVETITINGIDEIYCHPLKGPNFTLEQSNGIAYQVYDDLIASGSATSNDLVTRFLESSGIDTTKLNIQYVSGSNYKFSNFTNFSSAEERVNNFFYKVELIETYKEKYEGLISPTFIPPYGAFDGGILTQADPYAYDTNNNLLGPSSPTFILANDGYQMITEDGLFDVQWEIQQFAGVSQAGEAKKVLNAINSLIKGFDGFERFLYSSTNDLAYPKTAEANPITGLPYYKLRATTSSQAKDWYYNLVDLSSEYDKYNSNYLVNNIPEFIKEDTDNTDFLVFLDMIGQHFDILWVYINNLSKTKVLEHKQVNGFSNNLVHSLLESFGWNAKRAFNSELIWEYAFGTNKDGFQKYGMPLADANDEVWRRILNNLPYLLKHKGTARAMKAIMACYGVPQSMLTIMEFGGPQDPTKGGSSQFTFDDRTAAILLREESSVIVPWHAIPSTLEYPNCIEFRIRPSGSIDNVATLISGSEFTLDLVNTTGSFYKLELNFGGNDSNSTYFETGSVYVAPELNGEYAYGPDLKTGSLDFPLSNEHYSNVVINRHNNPDSSSWYEVWLGTSDGNRIITSVSMSMMYNDSQWTGSTPNLLIGGKGYAGEFDEFRFWKVPLQRSKFENHTLFPDAINGNDFDSSTKDLMFRLDFEYPKDRTVTQNIGIKNVAISDTYGEPFASASNMYSASTYPYQYAPYDRTVTATVPSLGFNYSNKIRFESASLVGDLSYKTRATKKAFDRAPIDTNRLGLFFSPIKELNMDILKAFGDFNIDNYIGDPGDEYKDTYSQLDTLRHYYFERLDNRDIYEYIRLIKYIDKSLFEVLSDLAPARTNIVKGLLIEPHYLERSKTRWDKPESLRNDFETSIDTNKNYILESESIPKDALLDATDVVTLISDVSSEETTIDANDVITFEGSNPNYDTTIDSTEIITFESSAPFYDTFIQCPNGATLIGEADSFTFTEIGMDKDSLANRGFGLYAKHGTGIVSNYEPLFGNYHPTSGSRKSIFLVKEQYSQNVNTLVKGWPTNGALLGEAQKYEKVAVTKYKYKVSTLNWSGSISIGNEVVSVEALNGYFPTHYKYKNNLGEGMIRSFWKGSTQTIATTPDGLDPVETFTTNPNILKVAKTGRGSGEPILEVD
jgi:hypothetical protein